MPTRTEILEALTVSQERLLARYQVFTSQELEQACTRSAIPEGASWRPQDHLAHLAMIERAFQGMIRRTLQAETDPVGFRRTGATTREEIIAWINRQNQEYVDAHHDESLEAVLADRTATRAKTLELLEQLTDEQLALPIPGSPWADGTIGGIILTNAHHEALHLSWMEEGLRS